MIREYFQLCQLGWSENPRCQRCRSENLHRYRFFQESHAMFARHHLNHYFNFQNDLYLLVLHLYVNV